MSEALDYLLKTRPEAMKNYFDFLKAAGKHLDRKTRAIISVITKVDKQTEAGFRQYLKRALNEGVTADEILDALLVAFPTLGLTKIVWAVDVLLEMDIPEFRAENLGSTGEWHDIAALDELSQGKVTPVTLAEYTVFIFMESETILVFDSFCPHQSTSIPVQSLQDCVLTCPKHQWKFDLKTGECIDNGDKPLRKLSHKVEDNRLWAKW